MTSQTKDRTKTRGPKRELFGQIALKKGFLTEEQLEQALERQKQIAAAGEKHKLLGLVMVELNLLSNAQLIEILKYIEAREGEHVE